MTASVGCRSKLMIGHSWPEARTCQSCHFMQRWPIQHKHGAIWCYYLVLKMQASSINTIRECLVPRSMPLILMPKIQYISKGCHFFPSCRLRKSKTVFPDSADGPHHHPPLIAATSIRIQSGTLLFVRWYSVEPQTSGKKYDICSMLLQHFILSPTWDLKQTHYSGKNKFSACQSLPQRHKLNPPQLDHHHWSCVFLKLTTLSYPVEEEWTKRWWLRQEDGKGKKQEGQKGRKP